MRREACLAGDTRRGKATKEEVGAIVRPEKIGCGRQRRERMAGAREGGGVFALETGGVPRRTAGGEGPRVAQRLAVLALATDCEHLIVGNGRDRVLPA